MGLNVTKLRKASDDAARRAGRMRKDVGGVRKAFNGFARDLGREPAFQAEHAALMKAIEEASRAADKLAAAAQAMANRARNPPPAVSRR